MVVEMMDKLNRVLADPSLIESVPREDITDVLGRMESLRVRLMARLFSISVPGNRERSYPPGKNKPAVEQAAQRSNSAPAPGATKMTYDEAGAADFLGCSRAALRRFRREGCGPRYVKIGKLVRYPQQGLAEYLEASAFPTPAPHKIRRLRHIGGGARMDLPIR